MCPKSPGARHCLAFLRVKLSARSTFEPEDAAPFGLPTSGVWPEAAGSEAAAADGARYGPGLAACTGNSTGVGAGAAAGVGLGHEGVDGDVREAEVDTVTDLPEEHRHGGGVLEVIHCAVLLLLPVAPVPG